MAGLTTSSTSTRNLSFETSLPCLGRVLPDAKTECRAVVAAGAETGAGAAPGATAAGACVGAGAASGAAAAHSTDSLGMLLTTGTHERKGDTSQGVTELYVWHGVCMQAAGSGHVITR